MTGPHQHMHNNSGPGGTVYANQGTQNIYLDRAKDHFDEGLRALKARLYPKAVQQFEESVTTATQAGLSKDADARDQIAAGHFYAALAMLGGRNPGDRGPEDIERIERHLEQALGYSDEVIVHQSKVVWALVKEDYYEAYGMLATTPDPAVFRQSVDHLAAGDLEPLVTHISRATGKTWDMLCERAVDNGLIAQPVVTAPVVRTRDPRRSEAVKKYFTPTPQHRTNSGFIAAFAGAVLLIVIGIAMRDFGTLLFLAGAGWLAKWGFEESGRYREYLRKFRLAEPKPTDQQIDKWLQEDITEISQRAGGRVRLNTELKARGGDLVYPVQIIVGYPSMPKAVGYRVRARRGADHKLRANTYDVLIMFLTNNLISTYRCLLDCHTGEVVLDEITEHHYRDIVGVASTSIPMPESLANLLAEIDEKHRNVPLAHTFSLSITSGESLSVATGFSRPDDGLTGDIAWGSNARALDVIKKMIRARHMA
jgi:hypothetical protein